MRIRNDRYLKTILLRITDSQAHTIDTDGTFLDSYISLLRHLLVERIFERIIPASICIFHTCTNGSLVDMPLHDMSVQTSVHHHTAFQIHE